MKKSIDIIFFICYINSTLREKSIKNNVKKQFNKISKKVLTHVFEFVIMCLLFEKEERNDL